MAACVERRAACGASYNACASGATPCKFETRQPARPREKRRRTVNFNAELGRAGLERKTEMLCSAVIQQCCFAENVAADEALERATAEWRLDRKNVLYGKFA